MKRKQEAIMLQLLTERVKPFAVQSAWKNKVLFTSTFRTNFSEPFATKSVERIKIVMAWLVFLQTYLDLKLCPKYLFENKKSEFGLFLFSLFELTICKEIKH